MNSIIFAILNVIWIICLFKKMQFIILDGYNQYVILTIIFGFFLFYFFGLYSFNDDEMHEKSKKVEINWHTFIYM